MLLTSDEEGDAIDGVRRVAEAFRERGQTIDWCITGEPSSTERLGDLLRVGRRGSLSGTLTVKGVQGHVAYPHKARNPIHLAAPALAELVARQWDDGFESFPPTSLQLSNIHAGTGANNVIPGELQVAFNLRYTPHWDAAPGGRNHRAARSACAGLRCAGTAAASRSIPRKGGCAASRVRSWGVRRCAAGRKHRGGTSDARFIAPLGAQCIEMGPVNASIHQVDEHVRVADLQALPALYRTLIERLLVE